MAVDDPPRAADEPPRAADEPLRATDEPWRAVDDRRSVKNSIFIEKKLILSKYEDCYQKHRTVTY